MPKPKGKPGKSDQASAGTGPAGLVTEEIDAVIRTFSANPDAPAIHASSIAMLVSPLDFVLLIGQLDTTPDGAKLTKAATIFFSPGHAKQLSRILIERVAQYESNYGPIAPKFFADEGQ